jgi:hypothetical protein
MNGLSSVRPHFVLGYHGCDLDIGEAALRSGDASAIVPSNRGHDWLGTGVYFWEGDPARALQWAHDQHKRQVERNRRNGTAISLQRPFVIGAVIRLGVCLDLTTSEGVSAIKIGYEVLQKSYEELKAGDADISLPVNTSDEDMRGRYLDFQVINCACREYEREKQEPIDTVRGLFPEGERVYPGAGFREKTHTQICVRRAEHSIIAYFRLPVGHH